MTQWIAYILYLKLKGAYLCKDLVSLERIELCINDYVDCKLDEGHKCEELYE